MMNLRKHLHSAILGWGLALALCVVLPTAQPAFAQTQNSNSQNPDVTRQEVATFDLFLDQHPDIDRQLRANPSLVNNSDFIEDHPALGQFLASHPEMTEELKENPRDFMHREQRFDRAENRARNPNPDVTRQEVANFDQFLDKHPDIDKQLTANPSLINNPDFVEDHPELGKFLASHPEVSEELKENPRDFMQREQRFDMAETKLARTDAQNPDLTTKQVAAFDKFLDHHKSIEKDLQKDPNLVNDPKFIKNHHDLQSFLEKNPGVSEELRENPPDFMRQESRFEGSERDRDNHIKRVDKDDHKKDRHDHDKLARRRMDRPDKDKHKKNTKERTTALEEKEKAQTSNPH